MYYSALSLFLIIFQSSKSFYFHLAFVIRILLRMRARQEEKIIEYGLIRKGFHRYIYIHTYTHRAVRLHRHEERFSRLGALISERIFSSSFTAGRHHAIRQTRSFHVLLSR